MWLEKKNSEHRACKITGSERGRWGVELRRGIMIWDSIDMIMPLRGLLSLSCLDLL
jgi:hypothetical protein